MNRSNLLPELPPVEASVASVLAVPEADWERAARLDRGEASARPPRDPALMTKEARALTLEALRKLTPEERERALAAFRALRIWNPAGHAQPLDFATFHAAGAGAPGRLGLRDMTGNAAAWTADRFEATAYNERRRDDPRGPGVGRIYVVRGDRRALARDGAELRAKDPPGDRTPPAQRASPDLLRVRSGHDGSPDPAIGFRCAKD